MDAYFAGVAFHLIGGGVEGGFVDIGNLFKESNAGDRGMDVLSGHFGKALGRELGQKLHDVASGGRRCGKQVSHPLGGGLCFVEVVVCDLGVLHKPEKFALGGEKFGLQSLGLGGGCFGFVSGFVELATLGGKDSCFGAVGGVHRVVLGWVLILESKVEIRGRLD